MGTMNSWCGCSKTNRQESRTAPHSKSFIVALFDRPYIGPRRVGRRRCQERSYLDSARESRCRRLTPAVNSPRNQAPGQSPCTACTEETANDLGDRSSDPTVCVDAHPAPMRRPGDQASAKSGVTNSVKSAVALSGWGTLVEKMATEAMFTGPSPSSRRGRCSTNSRT